MNAERAEKADRRGALARRGGRFVRLLLAALRVELCEPVGLDRQRRSANRLELLELDPGQAGQEDRFQSAVLGRPDRGRVDLELRERLVRRLAQAFIGWLVCD